jgi:hypothetical protein
MFWLLKTKQETEMQEGLEGLRSTLQSERQSSEEVKKMSLISYNEYNEKTMTYLLNHWDK